MTGIRIGELEEVEGFFEGFREEEGNGLGWAKLLILTYHNLYQTEKLIRLVLADSINGMELFLSYFNSCFYFERLWS